MGRKTLRPIERMNMIQLTGKKYLVTGGAGFIGSHIAEAIVAQGKRVVVIDNLVAGKKENLKSWWNSDNCTFLNIDIANFDDFWKMLTNVKFEDVDVVFHEAASKCTVCRENPLRDLMTNAWGTHNICEYARLSGVKKVIYASTGSVRDGEPVSFYGASKLAGESYLRSFKEYYSDFSYNILRYYHVFGPRQDGGEFGGVIPIFIKKILNNEPITIYGDGRQVRHFTWVGDVVKANFQASENENISGIFNVVSDIKISINELAMMIYEIIKKIPCIEYKPDKAGDIKKFEFKGNRFDMEYDNNFSDRLTETIDWYRSH